MEHNFERCCPKQRRYKPDFFIRESKKVWPADEEMKCELKLYDNAHSNEKNISVNYFNEIEKDLLIYANSKGEKLCENARESLITCLKQATYLSDCTDKINKFLQCVNHTIKEVYTPKN